MRKYRYLIAGAGSQGRAIAYRLARFSDTAWITLADTNETALKEARGKTDCSTSIAGFEFFCGNPLEIPHTELAKYDIVISALPTNLNYELAKLCLKAGVNYCDLGGNLAVTKKLLRLNKKALEKQLSFLVECGIQPGTGAVLIKIGYAIMEARAKIDKIFSYVGGLPCNPGKYPYYKKLFNLKGLYDILYEPALILKNGRPRFVCPMKEEVEKFTVEDVGVCEALTTGGLGLLPYNLKGMVREMREKTLRWPEFWTFAKNTPKEDFIKSLETLSARDDPDFTYLETQIIGRDGEKEVSVILSLYCKSDDVFTSMEKATGFSAAHMARMAAQRKSAYGVLPPEEALPLNDIFLELKKDFDIKTRLNG